MSAEQNSFAPVEHGCAYLEEWLNGLADNSLTGVPRWYTDFHVANCPYCRVALSELKSLRGRLAEIEAPLSDPPVVNETPFSVSLRSLQSLTPDRGAAVLAAWQEAETSRQGE